MDLVFGVISNKSLPNPRTQTFSPTYSVSYFLYMVKALDKVLFFFLSWGVWRGTYECSIALLLLLLSRFSHVRLCATLQTAAHQAPPSLGFSRQEHWSGLPFQFCQKSSDLVCFYLPLNSYFVTLIYLSFLTFSYYLLQLYNVLKSNNVSPQILSFFKVALVTLGSLHYHMNFTINFSIYTKKKVCLDF